MAKKQNNQMVPASLFEMTGELARIVQQIKENHGECSDETMIALRDWTAAIEDKGQHIAFAKARLESEAEYYKAIEEAAKARRKSTEGAAKRLTEYLAACMDVAGIKQIKDGGVFTISLCSGRQKINPGDISVLPLDCVEEVMVVKPNLDAIKARLEAGEKCGTAEIEIGQPYVMIRGGAKTNGE